MVNSREQKNSIISCRVSHYRQVLPVTCWTTGRNLDQRKFRQAAEDHAERLTSVGVANFVTGSVGRVCEPDLFKRRQQRLVMPDTVAQLRAGRRLHAGAAAPDARFFQNQMATFDAVIFFPTDLFN